LVGSPIATQMGVEQWDEWTETLTNPERYDDLCRALAESHEPRGDA
jgi:trans-2-enoyl-CoA reductase